MGVPVLSVNGLHVDLYLKDQITPVVTDVSFDVHEGETLGIVGESGCGKSMTCRSVMGLLPTRAKLREGTIELMGRDLLGKDRVHRRDVRGQDIAMIFQEPRSALNPLMTIGEHVAEPLKVHRRMSERESRAIVEQLLHDVGIPDPTARLHQYPHQISGGMCQRVMIATALACEPKLLIADEPTTALDVTIQAQILDLLEDLQGRRNLAMVLVSHDLGVIRKMAHRTVVMYAGRVVESGSTRELLENPVHPYTEGLIKALPESGHHGQELFTIPGTVPALGEIENGCKFAPRCPIAEEQCFNVEPPLMSVNSERQVRCWVRGHDDGGDQAGTATN